MDECMYCGAETMLFYCGMPVCPDCASRDEAAASDVGPLPVLAVGREARSNGREAQFE